MKMLRKGLNVLMLSVVVIALAITAVCFLVDPNRLKPVITAEVQKQTGYQLDIQGNFSWSFYPRIGIKAQGMQLTAPQQTKPFVSMSGVVLGMDFLQLIRGKSSFSGDVHVSQLTLMDIQARNVSADIGWEDNVLTISPFSASLYDGWMTATVYGRDLNKVNPRWSWEMQFSRIQLKPLLRDLSGKEGAMQVDGVGQLRMDASSTGASKSDFISNLNGSLTFNLSNGSVSGLDLNYLINRAVELIKKEPAATAVDSKQTAFEHLNGSMKIKRGVATTEDTLLVAPAFTVKANGSMDFSRQVIDYNLSVMPTQLDKLKWGVPIDVVGDIHDPTVKLDMLKLNTVIANDQFQKIKDKAQESIKKLPKRVDDFLQKILGDEK